MTTPSDPYNRANNRPFDEDDVLAPLAPAQEAESKTPSSPAQASSPESIDLPAIEPAVPERRSIFANTDPAFQQSAASAGTPALAASEPLTMPETEPVPEAPIRTSVTLADAVGRGSSAPSATSPAVGAPTATFTPDVELSHVTKPETATRQSTWDEAVAPQPALPPLPGGRGWTHTGVLIATLLLVPFAWYLISDAGVRLSLVDHNPWETGTLNLAALGELAGGIAVIALAWYFAKLSSLGAIVTGLLVTVFGGIAIFAPALARDNILSPLDDAIGGYNDFTANVIHHLTLDLSSGRIFVFGAIVLLTGLLAHGTRRSWQRRGVLIARHELASSGEV